MTARLIAKRRRVGARFLEEYFIAGLLHDIGKIPMNNRFSHDYIIVLASSERDGIPLFSAESQEIGMNHAQVGAMILKAWNLDEAIQDVVLHHHKPQGYKGAHGELLSTVVLANYFVNDAKIGFSGDCFPATPSQAVYTSLNISMNMLKRMEDAVNQEIERASIFLKIAL